MHQVDEEDFRPRHTFLGCGMVHGDSLTDCNELTEGYKGEKESVNVKRLNVDVRRGGECM